MCGAADDARPCDTIKEAKAFARRAITAEYQASVESSAPFYYAEVRAQDKDDETVFIASYFHKDHPRAGSTNKEDAS